MSEKIQNPLRAAYRNALHNARMLDTAFGRFLGGSQHPRGALLSLYRDARRDIADKLRADRRERDAEITQILLRLERDLRSTTSEALRFTADQGARSAEVQARYYIDDGQPLALRNERPDLRPLQNAWLGMYEQQRLGVLAALASNETDVILGGEDRMGILQPAPVAREGSRYLAKALGLGFIFALFGRRRPEADWMKQAIPVIDSDTTDCCLSVAGQTKPFNGKFILTGTPRFSRRQDWTPFHWYCRTSVALYKPEYDDGLTDELRSQVQQQREQREEQADG